MLYLKNKPEKESFELRRALEAAEGYLYLRMPDDALGELDAIQPRDRQRSAVLRARIRVLLHLRRWDDAAMLSFAGIERDRRGGRPAGVVAGSSCRRAPRGPPAGGRRGEARGRRDGGITEQKGIGGEAGFRLAPARQGARGGRSTETKEHPSELLSFG